MTQVSDILASLDYGPAPEDSSAARAWLAQRGRFGLFIGGEWTAPGEVFATRDPFTGEVLAEVTQGTEADVAAAIVAARAAQPGWAGLGGHGRARVLYALARTVQKRERFLAVLETLDTGKPIRESRDVDIPLVARHFTHHAGWAELLESELPGHAPLGVCGQIIPWNFPLLMLAWKIAPALAAGNTVVLKPAEYTPLTALAFAEICAEVGVPPGIVNIVTGDGATGAALVGAGVDKIAFTGSTEVGRRIAEATAGTGVRLTLELGGKSPFVVLEDADLDAAVEGVVDLIWFNQGQVCCAGSRIFVAEAVAEAFEARLRTRMARLRVGPPLDKSTDVGAIVDPVQKARILEIVGRAVGAGAELVGGQAGEGCVIAPGYLRGIAPANPGMVEEIFGPIATLTTFRTPDEAVELANATRYGLAASVWSEGAVNATDIAAQVRAGIVWVNCANLFDAAAPFGGVRESGYGREGGRAGMRDYLRAPGEAAPDVAVPEAWAAFDGAVTAEAIDRTPKLYIGGAQKRPDGGASARVAGRLVPVGNRKDIRNAVEAAHNAGKWAVMGGHARAQVLYYLAENLAARDFGPEGEAAVRRAFFWAGFADKLDGAVVGAKPGHLVTVLNEPHGVMGIVAPTAAPLLGLLSLVLPAIAMGNAVVAVPSQADPGPALDLVQVLETSDVPAGVVNLVTGPRDALAEVLAAHDDVAALWLAAGGPVRTACERAAAGNLKPVWVPPVADWSAAQGRVFAEHAVRTKTVWLPYGALPAGTGGSAY